MRFNDLHNINIYKQALGISEGSGSYSAVYRNKKGVALAFGLYQFIKARIDKVASYASMAVPDTNTFLNSPALQDKFFEEHINLSLVELEKKGLMRHIGETITGKNKFPFTNVINIYGLLGGVHLGGETGVFNLLEKNKDAKDDNGTYISDYVSKFSAKVPSEPGFFLRRGKMIIAQK